MRRFLVGRDGLNLLSTPTDAAAREAYRRAAGAHTAVDPARPAPTWSDRLLMGCTGVIIESRNLGTMRQLTCAEPGLPAQGVSLDPRAVDGLGLRVPWPLETAEGTPDNRPKRRDLLLLV
jgi:hypothetical protein